MSKKMYLVQCTCTDDFSSKENFFQLFVTKDKKLADKKRVELCKETNRLYKWYKRQDSVYYRDVIEHFNEKNSNKIKNVDLLEFVNWCLMGVDNNKEHKFIFVCSEIDVL